MRFSLIVLVALALQTGGEKTARCDEFSGADKMRVLYSPQFYFTKEGLPLVTVRVAEADSEVRLRGNLQVMPDGEMGSEVISGKEWTVRLKGGAQPAQLRYHVVVRREKASQIDALRKEMVRFRSLGFAPQTFEMGAVFGIAGEVLDARSLLIAVAPKESEAAAKDEARRLAQEHKIETSVHTELVRRPYGILEAVDERGVVVRNENVLWFSPSSQEPIQVDPPGRKYAGQLYVTVDRQGKLAIVNAVPEDRLLSGLVPAEMLPSAPLESLKAQAVAARNQLLAKLGARHVGDPYRLCSTVHCQVYAGANRESPRTTQAVLATRGELLVAPGKDGDTLVDTVYSASCGGHTEDNDQAWGSRPDPILRGKLDLPEGEQAPMARFAGRLDEAALRLLLARPLTQDPRPLCGRVRGGQAAYRWQVRVDAATIVGAAFMGKGKLKEIEILERGASGRVVSLRLRGTQGDKEVHTELEVRRLFGGLRSSMFLLAPLRRGGVIEAVDVLGAGYGHGVGMCQNGAMALGEIGWDYKKILQHYYPGARLRRLY